MPEHVPLETLILLHEQGLTPAQIAPLVDRAPNTVSERLRKAGYRMGREVKLPSAAELQQLLATMSARDIAAKYGTRVDSVYYKISGARRRGEITVTPTVSASVRAMPTPPAEEDWDNVPCKKVDPEMFFPTVPANQEGGLQKARLAARAAAEVACNHCPLRQPCYAGALKRGEPFGVWGGVLFRNGKPVQAGAA